MTGRVAIYAAPGMGSMDPGGMVLREKAESWLGRSVDGGAPDPGLPDGWDRATVDGITIDARRYGFHATLKAPFRLAEGRTLQQLDESVAVIAASTDAVVIPELALSRLGDFFALVPGGPVEELHALADTLVTEFDPYRAPATPAEVERRNPAALSPRRRELLEAWGYPYVFEEYRFHLTLTDRIPTIDQPAVREALADWFADSIGQPLLVDSLALFTEAEPGAPFQLHSVHSLRPDHEGSR